MKNNYPDFLLSLHGSKCGYCRPEISIPLMRLPFKGLHKNRYGEAFDLFMGLIKKNRKEIEIMLSNIGKARDTEHLYSMECKRLERKRK